MEMSDLDRIQRALEDLHLVEEPALEADGTEALAEDQAIAPAAVADAGANLGVLGEMVAHHLGFRPLAVEVDAQPGCLAGGIVGDGHVDPLPRR